MDATLGGAQRRDGGLPGTPLTTEQPRGRDTGWRHTGPTAWPMSDPHVPFPGNAHPRSPRHNQRNRHNHSAIECDQSMTLGGGGSWQLALCVDRRDMRMTGSPLWDTEDHTAGRATQNAFGRYDHASRVDAMTTFPLLDQGKARPPSATPKVAVRPGRSCPSPRSQAACCSVGVASSNAVPAGSFHELTWGRYALTGDSRGITTCESRRHHEGPMHSGQPKCRPRRRGSPTKLEQVCDTGSMDQPVLKLVICMKGREGGSADLNWVGYRTKHGKMTGRRCLVTCDSKAANQKKTDENEGLYIAQQRREEGPPRHQVTR